jgi:hypothetical protein
MKMLKTDKSKFLTMITIILLGLFSLTLFAQEKAELKIDPLMLVSLKECRSITQQIGNQFFPGWQFSKTPILFYRPKVQEVLINYPHKPKGFSEYNGYNLLGNEKIYYRNDTTFFNIDGQNTSFDIDSITVLVVADRSSNLRSQLMDVAINRPEEYVQKYFDTWAFMPSAYNELSTILHEAFHVYQHNKAPEKFANEAAVIKYPVLDPVNNALYVLEGNILRDALLAKDAATKLEKTEQFVAVRTYRQSLLDSTLSEYENLNEYAEGIAKYIEYMLMKTGGQLVPGKEMNYYAGFNGYEGTLSKMLIDEINSMVAFVSVINDAFANKFGTGPLRFKLYKLGACESLLLDDLMPSWKENIFNDNVYLCDLLKESLKLSPSQLQQYLQTAKTEYNYDKAYSDKLQFQKDGEQYARNKADKIFNTDKTLIRISYEGFTDKAYLYRFTPFGITKVNQSSTIYDLVPILIGFKEGVKLDMKQATPVLIDKEKKQVVFAVTTAATDIKLVNGDKIDCNDFLLSGANMEISILGNIVNIKFR